MIKKIVLFLFIGLYLMLDNLFAASFVYDDHGKRDPFWPLVTPKGDVVIYEKDYLLSDLVLEGIMTESNGKNIAIINGNILSENDSVGSFIIEKIEQRSVILKKDQRRFTLQLKKED